MGCSMVEQELPPQVAREARHPGQGHLATAPSASADDPTSPQTNPGIVQLQFQVAADLDDEDLCKAIELSLQARKVMQGGGNAEEEEEEQDLQRALELSMHTPLALEAAAAESQMGLREGWGEGDDEDEDLQRALGLSMQMNRQTRSREWT